MLVAALVAISMAGALYQLFAAYALRRFMAKPREESAACPPVSVLKPVCGNDAGLYENLKSFCEQGYPRFQVIFGAQAESDPAVPIIRRLMADLPSADLDLVIDERIHGSNLKVSNLINMMGRVRHDVVVVADSDMRVGPNYLRAIVGPLLEPRVGLVTCLYAGRPSASLWARMAAMWINYGFLPSVLVSRLIGGDQACFGATLALRRGTLERCGGFAALRDCLADDYRLGTAVRRLGLQVVLSRYIVDAMVEERSLSALWRHELRWGRTIRSIAPIGFALSGITYPIITSILAILLSGLGRAAMMSLAVALFCRLVLVRSAAKELELERTDALLVPLRDLLSFAVLVVSFCGRTVDWRDRRFRVTAAGRLVSIGEPIDDEDAFSPSAFL